MKSRTLRPIENKIAIHLVLMTSAFVIASLTSMGSAIAIAKVVDCEEARMSPNEVEVALFLDEKNQYQMHVDSVAMNPSSPVHLQIQVQDESSKFASGRGPRTTKALYKTKGAELEVYFTEGKTPAGDEGFTGRLKVEGSSSVEADMVCWFSKKAQDPSMMIEVPAPEVPTVDVATKAKPQRKPGSKITLKPNSKKGSKK